MVMAPGSRLDLDVVGRWPTIGPVGLHPIRLFGPYYREPPTALGLRRPEMRSRPAVASLRSRSADEPQRTAPDGASGDIAVRPAGVGVGRVAGLGCAEGHDSDGGSGSLLGPTVVELAELVASLRELTPLVDGCAEGRIRRAIDRISGVVAAHG
jgi:hypothetical protein